MGSLLQYDKVTLSRHNIVPRGFLQSFVGSPSSQARNDLVGGSVGKYYFWFFYKILGGYCEIGAV